MVLFLFFYFSGFFWDWLLFVLGSSCLEFLFVIYCVVCLWGGLLVFVVLA